VTFSITALDTVMLRVSFMPRVTNKPIMLNVILLIVMAPILKIMKNKSQRNFFVLWYGKY
jgi:hypothetical protein